jgi:eukaryotic-like serine/threonine-protein kinase
VTPPDDDLGAFEGRTLSNRYLLRRRLGEGAFGAVFLSEQQLLGVPIRRVALKLSKRAGLTVEEARKLFSDAIVLAEAMDSIKDADARRHLVHVYDAGIAADLGNRGYLVMEYVDGSTLAKQFASYGRVPDEQLMTWVGQLCTALRGLHGMSPPLLHRDIKPDNVLLGHDNSVRLVDFGLAARLLDHGQVPGVAGTVRYMAPETSQGESVPASDIYSLGLLIYEGLTGSHPFDHLVPPAELPEALHSEWLFDRKRREPAVRPSARNATISPGTDRLVLRCLEFEPRRRYHDVGELLAELTKPDAAPTVLEQVTRRQAEGDLAQARSLLEARLAAGDVPDRERFQLLRQLGDGHRSAREYTQAAAVLKRAWDLTAHGGLLSSRAGRAELLGQLADCYALAGNDYQADRYRRRRDEELRGGRP